jgi:uncharacterized membrane protein YdjX (TVP38/TMEM64 family)
MNRIRLLVVILIVVAAAAALSLDAGRLLSLDYLQERYAALGALVESHRALSSLVFFLLYTVLAGLSVPGTALVFTLAAGALFGRAWGSVLVSFASSIGATLACALSRFLLQELIERHFPYAVDKVNEGIREDGAYYLFGLRLVPIFPFFIINAVMGVTRLPLRTFYWVSQVGMLPGTVVFVNAGTELAGIRSAGDILAPDVALSLALLGVFPLVAKRIAPAVLAWHRRL